MSLASDAADAGLVAEPVDSTEEALQRIAELARRGGAAPRILIGGSLYFAGTVLEDNGTIPE